MNCSRIFLLPRLILCISKDITCILYVILVDRSTIWIISIPSYKQVALLVHPHTIAISLSTMIPAGITCHFIRYEVSYCYPSLYHKPYYLFISIICCIFFRLPQQLLFDFRGHISTRISQWDVYGSSIIPYTFTSMCKLLSSSCSIYVTTSYSYNGLILTYRVIEIHVHGPFYIRPFIIHGILYHTNTDLT